MPANRVRAFLNQIVSVCIEKQIHLWCSSSWLHTAELDGMNYSSLVAHTEQYYTGDKGAVIHPDVIPTWTLNVGLGTSSTYSIQDCEAQSISMS